MIELLLFLLLPLASLSGWLIGRRALSLQTVRQFLGLNKVLNSNPNKAVDVISELIDSDQDVVDTHLALGGAFRRSGEVDKAVGIHQNLINKSSLTQEQRSVSLLELSQDYMRAGMLDRAESILLDLIEQGHQLNAGYQLLLDIYQQSKDWTRAIQISQEWEEKTKKKKSHTIAHFYCELAEQQWLKGEKEDARRHLKSALKANTNCVRANLLSGNMEAQSGHFQEAIRAYQEVHKQDPNFVSEIILPMARCYESLGDTEGMVTYFEECSKNRMTTATVLAFSEWLFESRGEQEAVDFITQHLRRYPSLRGLSRLIQFSIDQSESSTRQDLLLFKGLIEKMLTKKPLYQCEACGFSSRVLQWQCPGCKRWDMIKPIHEQ